MRNCYERRLLDSDPCDVRASIREELRQHRSKRLGLHGVRLRRERAALRVGDEARKCAGGGAGKRKARAAVEHER